MLRWNGICLLCIFSLNGVLAIAGEETTEVVPVETPRTFYVDSETGQDGADGQSEERAWRSLGHVNSADLKPGDTVRFKRGCLWRGSLVPASGDETAPITYTAYGEGPKPLFLGSVPRNRPEDWVQVEGKLWATLPLKHERGPVVLDLQEGPWWRHQEGGASVAMRVGDTAAGKTFRFECGNSGSASNHVQFWGPELPVEQDTWLTMTFRARSSIPFPLPALCLRRGSYPWTPYASAPSGGQVAGPEWPDYEVMLRVTKTADAGRVHMCLGGLLPAGAVFEFQPQHLYTAVPNVSDPLLADVGNIIFDHGNQCGWKKWSIDTLDKPYDYFYEASSHRIYLYLDAHPATRHKSIELALKRHIVNQSGVHYATFNGLELSYGAAHGFGGGGTHHLIIRDCDLSYIGGGHQLSLSSGAPVRYGNAIEFWGPAHDHLVEGCRIWEIYDAALTNQSRGDKIRQEDITYRNNIIWNSEYSFEYWNNPESAVTKNIHFVNNTCVDAGKGWAHAQRPTPNGSHLMFYTNTAATSGFEVKYNVFCNVTEWGSRYSAGWESLPDMDYNLWFSEQGIMAYFFKDRIAGFEDYRKTTGLEEHSLFADPLFVDATGGDYRLSSTSPGRTIRPNGGPVGAESLWK